MADEFQESDIVFSDDDYRSDRNQTARHNHFPCRELVPRKSHLLRTKSKKKKRTMANSVPVKIPKAALQSLDSDFEEDFNDGEMVPPHLIVERRIAGEMTFSVCTGIGKTLKVRNAVLRMTGFLES